MLNFYEDKDYDCQQTYNPAGKIKRIRYPDLISEIRHLPYNPLNDTSESNSYPNLSVQNDRL